MLLLFLFLVLLRLLRPLLSPSIFLLFFSFAASYELSLQNWWLWTPSLSPLLTLSRNQKSKFTQSLLHSLMFLIQRLLPTLRRCHHRHRLPSRPGHPCIDANAAQGPTLLSSLLSSVPSSLLPALCCYYWCCLPSRPGHPFIDAARCVLEAAAPAFFHLPQALAYFGHVRGLGREGGREGGVVFGE